MTEVAVGPELDALVATEVMELPQENGKFYRDVLRMRMYGLPCYSTNITSAWQVVERMRELGYELFLEGPMRGEKYDVSFTADPHGPNFHEGIKGKSGNAQSESCPTAISRAALAAVRNQNDS